METLFQWWLLAPEITVAATGILALALDLLLPERLKPSLRRIPSLGLLLAAGLSIWLACNAGGEGDHAGAPGFAKTFQTSGGINTFFILAALAAVWLGGRFFKRNGLPVAEFHFLIPVVAAALMLLQGSRHFILFFTALEASTTGLCVLAAYNRRSGTSLEAGLKYLLAAGISGSLLLLGIVLLHGVAGNPVLNALDGTPAQDALYFDVLQTFVAAHPTHPLVLVGAALVTAGVAFKIGLAPFQQWVPDVYQGAPSPVTAFFATASKLAGILALHLLLSGPFSALVRINDGKPGPLLVLLGIMIALTFAFSTLTALGQSNTKRLMGLSGLSHAAFLALVVLVLATHPTQHIWNCAMVSLCLYAFAYLAASTTIFAVMGEVATAGGETGLAAILKTDMAEDADAGQRTTDFQLLRERQPFLCGALCTGLASLAGIPPTAGFFAKLLVLGTSIGCGIAIGPGTPAATFFWALSGVALLAACGGVYYYFAWMREAFQRHWIPEERRERFAASPLNPSVGTRLALIALSVAILLLGLLPAFLCASSAPPDFPKNAPRSSSHAHPLPTDPAPPPA
ncbi:MAG: hypothetical protein LBG65_00755 [Puniceicoccales bacterium]|jgi:NADH-quinone oxidoreductase subunit N|nr:hypothetical protein [Puniceicoccales bacterium]